MSTCPPTSSVAVCPDRSVLMLGSTGSPDDCDVLPMAFAAAELGSAAPLTKVLSAEAAPAAISAIAKDEYSRAAQHQTVVRVRGMFISGSRGVAMTYGEAQPPKHRALAQGAPRPLIRAAARQGQTDQPLPQLPSVNRRPSFAPQGSRWFPESEESRETRSGGYPRRD